MDPNQEPTFEDSVKEVMEALPPVLRHYLADAKYVPVVQGLMQKYKLRVDQSGVLERELILLLMGIESAQEFTDTLANQAGLNLLTISSIIQDINTQIFMPLRDAERRGVLPEPTKPPQPQAMPARTPAQPPAVPPQPKPMPTAAPVMQMPSSYAPPPQSPRYPHQQAQEPAITFTRPAANKPAPPPQRAEDRSSAPSGLPTSDPAHLLEDHEEPHIEFHKLEVSSPEAEGSPVPPAPSIPRNAPPPNLPGIVPAPPLTPAPRPEVAAPKIEAPPAQRPYSTDPYREPLE